jgi:protein O-GlcNAc transferase
VFPRIAREAGDCQFVFIQYQGGSHVTELFRRRLGQAFDAFGLKAEDYCVFLPRLKGPRYVAAVGQADVVLDSIGWSGCNSTLESLPFDLPIVTLTSPLMRGRHSTAILAMIGVTETAANTTDDYVSVAVRLSVDKSWRAVVRNRMAENKHRIYRDRACVAALGEFLSKAVRRGASGQ